MFNRVILIGRLTQDPELRHTSSGVPVASFALAVERGFTNNQGEQEVDFINIVAWRKLGETCANYISKGSLVAVEGRLQIRSYDDSQGVRRKASEVVVSRVKFLDSKKDSAQSKGSFNSGGPSGSEKDNSNDFGDFGSEISFNQDDVPF